MYIAELQGKLPSKIARSEDILTSNVFSFFKYAKRSIYLKEFLSLLNIFPAEEELQEAEFKFWPDYDDKTQPDVVILVGNYYLLFEAKYCSDFGKETSTQQQQLIREIEGGMNEAKSLKKKFILVTITADYNEPKQKFTAIIPQYQEIIQWINWQAVAQILLEHLEQVQEQSPEVAFAQDLYNLLAHKQLRSFLPFERLTNQYTFDKPSETIFFSAQTARFRGSFLGFQKVLSHQKSVQVCPQRIFYAQKHGYFKYLPTISLSSGNIFYQGGNV